MDRYLPPLSETAARWARFFGLLLAFALLLWLAERLRGVLTPLAIGLALAYICNPLVTWLERHGIRRLVSITLLYVVGLGAMFLAALFLVPSTIAQVRKLADNLPRYFENARQWLNGLAPELVNRLGDKERLAALASEHGASVAKSLLAFTEQFFANATHWLTAALLIPIYAFFFLWRFNALTETVRNHLPTAYRPTLTRIFTTIDRATANFFRGRLILCLVVGVLDGLGWLLVGVPYSLPFGILVGILTIAPFIPVLALPPVLLFSYLEAVNAGQSWFWPVVLAFGVWMVVQVLESFVLHPAIMAHSAGLHPITIIVVLLIGAELAGFLGLLLAIPVASTLKSLAAEFLLPEIRRLATQPEDGEPPPPIVLPAPAAVPPPGNKPR